MSSSPRLLSGMSSVVIALVALLAACDRPVATDPEVADGPAFAVSGSMPIACPVSESRSATGVVGPEGGTVSLDGHSVVVPAGAVSEPTTITLTAPASQYAEIDLTANGADHFAFAVPVSVTISYERCARKDLDALQLAGWYIDPESKELLERQPSEDRKASRRVVFSTGHFSHYALAD